MLFETTNSKGQNLLQRLLNHICKDVQPTTAVLSKITFDPRDISWNNTLPVGLFHCVPCSDGYIRQVEWVKKDHTDFNENRGLVPVIDLNTVYCPKCKTFHHVQMNKTNNQVLAIFIPKNAPCFA